MNVKEKAIIISVIRDAKHDIKTHGEKSLTTDELVDRYKNRVKDLENALFGYFDGYKDIIRYYAKS